MRWLIVRLEAPLMSFGGAAIDAHGVSRDFPALSALAGLFANALGVKRWQTDQLEALQKRLVFAAALENHAPLRVQDFQTVRLGQDDKGWTTRGEPEGRNGAKKTYKSPHIRYRDYLADSRVTVVARLARAKEIPTLDHIATALDRPARPLFIGRKHALPSVRLNGGYVDGDSARAALCAALADVQKIECRALWPADHDTEHADRAIDLCDQRTWPSGLHGGTRRVAEGRLGQEDSS